MSEKRLVRVRGQALRSPNTGLTGPQRAVHHPALHSRIFYFFGPELGLYQNSLASQRSILEHVSICSPSQFVHRHRKLYRLFFERELDGTAPISVRVIATIGITHGRKTVSPSRNPCDSDPFLVANSQSSTSVAKLFAFMGPTPIYLSFGPELERRSWDYIEIISPHNAQLLGTYRSVRLHNSFTCMENRIDYFSSRSSMEPHRFMYE